MVQPIFGLLLWAVLLSCSTPAVEPVDLTCNQMHHPLSIHTATPLLGWKLADRPHTAPQTAYRIVAASTAELLQQERADLWDSGIVPGANTRHIAYGGAPLASRQKVYWKVQVWNGGEEPSPWSTPAWFEVGLLHPSDWTAQWIGYAEDSAPNEAKTHPAPYFRRNFEMDKPIRSARLYVTGLGFYELYINGQRIGTQEMAPAVTNYDRRSLQKLIYFYDDQSTQRVLYNTFDVLHALRNGLNTVGMVLGNGWYNQRDRTVEGCMWYDTPRLLFQLEIEYADATTQTITSDDSWKTTTGPLLHDGIFTGEIYDARKEHTGWNTHTYQDTAWQQAQTVRPPVGKLEPQSAPFDRVMARYTPQLVERLNDSTWRYRLPHIISGRVKLTTKAERGDSIRLKFLGEENEDFGQTDLYICKGGAIESWHPRFTWHAFREFDLTTRQLTPSNITFEAQALYTDVEQAGTFTSSNPLFNAIESAYRRTQEANFHGSVSSDCPHRERLAYTGDGQVAVEAAIYSYNMTRFYSKWFNDMEDARNHKTGYVPHTAPFGGGGGGPAWGSAMVIMPWTYYQFYGDESILRTHYNAMTQWVEYLGTRTDKEGIVVREEPNGWCLDDWCTPQSIELPEPLVNTAYYYHVTHLMAQVARVLNKTADQQLFEQLALNIKAQFNKRFYNPQTGHYGEGRQGADLFPLAFGMVTDENRTKVFNALLDHLHQLDYHFDTGILATPLLLKVLTQEGRVDLAYKLMDQRTAPSFAYLLNPQYSGMWEDWHGKSSRNHPMFGSVVAWFYNALAGIKPNPDAPGMQQFMVEPHFPDSLNQLDASYKTLYGTIRSAWTRQPNGTIRLTVHVPTNCSARVTPPSNCFWTTGQSAPQTLSAGTHTLEIKPQSTK